MTDRIDLDETDVDSEQAPDANHGDWFRRDGGNPDAEPDPDERWLDPAGTCEVDDASDSEGTGDGGTETGDPTEDDAGDSEKRDHDPVLAHTPCSDSSLVASPSGAARWRSTTGSRRSWPTSARAPRPPTDRDTRQYTFSQ